MSKSALLFPGQGSQYVGMGRALAERYSAARRTFEEAGDALGWDVLRLCAEGDMAELTRTENAQPAILTHSVAAYRAWTEDETAAPVEPAVCAGHSLGEFSALACSGALGFADAVRLVRARGEFMQEAARRRPGGMAAVGGIGGERLEELLAQASDDRSVAVLAGINSPEQRVVSGHRDALLRLEKLLSGERARFTFLNVGAAFHSPLMEEASERFRERLEACAFHVPRRPVLSGVTGQLHTGGRSEFIRLLALQLTQPVRWLDCMETMRDLGVGRAFELGPGRVLTRLWQSFAPLTDARASDDGLKENPHEAPRPSASVRPVPVSGQTSFLSRCLGIAAATRNRGFADPESYRIGVIEPYREVEALAREIERKGASPTEEQLRRGWDMLLSQFETKRTDPDERRLRLSRLLEETGTSHLFEIRPDSVNQGGVAK
ncbi:ACP S-malonyltransferase [Cohnella sp. CFH 77786]|uniref:ACP S-malonyltransferase n=1 Tax=Cohnella sp. CFH 77786 TaxID=2662265 RepID=UPI001C608ADC|nr:ACP S-malonyltransferase [Cohnella sp. CFH 77786]MBW5449440.1 ACP S-malonyltransferase [Cohnella sp. CFH 77786]